MPRNSPELDRSGLFHGCVRFCLWRPSVGNLRRIFYVSRVDASLDSATVKYIVFKSQRNNRQKDVTGVLAHSGRHFAQVLEGTADNLTALADKIGRDKRHTEVTVTAVAPWPARFFFMFATWPGPRIGHAACRSLGTSTTRSIAMNKDQVKGAVKDAAGKVQQKAGDLVGNHKQEAKGLAKQAEGKTQKAVGDVKEAVKDARK